MQLIKFAKRVVGMGGGGGVAKTTRFNKFNPLQSSF